LEESELSEERGDRYAGVLVEGPLQILSQLSPCCECDCRTAWKCAGCGMCVCSGHLVWGLCTACDTKSQGDQRTAREGGTPSREFVLGEGRKDWYAGVLIEVLLLILSLLSPCLTWACLTAWKTFAQGRYAGILVEISLLVLWLLSFCLACACITAWEILAQERFKGSERYPPLFKLCSFIKGT
jgi:hypothetical protein